MKVALINHFKERFKTYLLNQDLYPNAFYFSVIQTWQNNWNLEGPDLANIYDKSLQSTVSARLWGGNVNSPKSIMIQLMNEEEAFMRATFRDLFNEQLDLGLRLDRFGFHTDQVFNKLQSKDPTLVSHLHNDRQILCLYLSLEYPSRYCLFDYPAFYKMMTLLESRNIPTEVEVERYYKSCRGIKNILLKDEELVQCIVDKAKVDHLAELPLMVLSHFMEYLFTNE